MCTLQSTQEGFLGRNAPIRPSLPLFPRIVLQCCAALGNSCEILTPPLLCRVLSNKIFSAAYNPAFNKQTETNLNNKAASLAVEVCDYRESDWKAA